MSTEVEPRQAEANGKPAHPEFPVESFREAAPLLRRPFTVEAVKWKVQSTWPKQNPNTGLVVPYIDARLVDDRLNIVIPDKWYARYDGAWCYLTVDDITRCDVGEGQGKALVSDSRKRAARQFGIGVSLNAVPKITFQKGDFLRGTERLRLTDAGEAECRAIYREWGEAVGWEHFGEPLEHGDALGSVGDPDEDREPELKADAPLPVEGQEADALREAIRGLYEELRTIDPKIVKPAEYAKWSQDADTSLEGLRALADLLSSKLFEVRNKAEGSTT